MHGVAVGAEVGRGRVGATTAQRGDRGQPLALRVAQQLGERALHGAVAAVEHEHVDLAPLELGERGAEIVRALGLDRDHVRARRAAARPGALRAGLPAPGSQVVQDADPQTNLLDS